MAVKLSQGALMTILNGGEVESPTMQVLGHKKIAANGMNERYRLLISDGVHLNSFAMLATQLNGMITTGELSDNSVIRINRHIISSVNSNTGKGGNKRVLIILDLSVLVRGTDVGAKIGDPTPLVDSATGVHEQQPSSVGMQQQNISSAAVVPSPLNEASSFNGNNTITKTATGYSTAFSSNCSSTGMKQTHPISSLNPFQSRWIIKARVTNKSAIRTWSNARNNGKLFSIDLTDESGCIKATAFNDQCDKFYDMIEPNKVYFVSKCQLKPANKKFSSLKHDFEMSFTNDTNIVISYDNDESIPHLKYDFTMLNVLKDMETDSFVDVIGICQSCSELQSFVAKVSRKELKKKDLILVDQTLSSIGLTLWDTQCEEFDGSLQPVVAVKGGRIVEFNGSKSISLVSSSVIQVNPDIPEAHRLRGWFDSLPTNVQFNNISSKIGDGVSGKILTFKEVRMNNIGNNPDKADYFNVEGTVFFMQSDRALYQACPSANCQKKVIDQNNGMYRCEKCSREFPNFKYRLLLAMQICDWTGSQWVNAFQDAAEVLLKATAEEIGNSRDTFNNYDSYFRKALFNKFLFRIRAKMDTFNNETRLRMSVVNVKPFNYKESCQRMLNELKTFTGISINNRT